MPRSQPKVGVVSLGCPKAQVDSEQIITRLNAAGYGFAESHESADVVVINTCGFIDSARAESLDAIGEAMARNGKVVVTGCLGMDQSLIQNAHPGVMAISGPHDPDSVLRAVQKAAPTHRQAGQMPIPGAGLRLTPSHYAYLKIAEGCDHRCSFCIIPSLRGGLDSRPIDQVLREAETLVGEGVKEILVISQDTGAYGRDLGHGTGQWRGQNYETRLDDLCRGLGELGAWVRLHYVYPYPFIDTIIPLMAEGRILPYLDIPFQHAHPRVLKAMRRPGMAERTLQRIARWREICPELTIRSTFVVGFPGETEEEFEFLLDWLEQARLDRVGCFAYEPVAGAEANQLADPVDEDDKQDRRERLMSLQYDISEELTRAKIGRILPVLIDEADEDGAVGRSPGDAPEIDGVVHLPGASGLQPGDLRNVKITDADAYDLWGEISE